jgi:DNA-binding CsgD family transcriptional regulator
VSSIVGRAEELAALSGFVDDVRTGPAALVLEGEPGIGKSTLLRAAVEEAEARGLRVLVARPTEAEQGLGHVALGDLLDGTLDEVLPALPAPRRHALEITLLLEEGTADPRAVGLATRSVLELLAVPGPLLVAIDDAQWLDAASERALAFALRRLETCPVLVLLARRTAQTTDLERALGPERVRGLEVSPLGVGALHRFLRDRLDRAFARQTLLRIHERSGGNPFFALELARIVQPDADPTQPLPVPQTLEEVVGQRLAGLPPSTRDALALLSASGPASPALLERAGLERSAPDPAVAAQVLEREEGVVRFTHPLLATVVYRGLGDERLEVHARLAGLVDEPLVRARHLALSRETPNAGVAGALDAAMSLAAARGASAAAAELAEHALRLTPPEDRGERRRRALAAARAHREAGEWTRARTIALELLDGTGESEVRADALVLLAELETVERAVPLLEEALDEAASRPELRAEIHCRLAWATRFREGYVHALDHARTALALADGLDDDRLRARAGLVRAILGWIVGDGAAPELPLPSDDLATALGGERLVQEATFAVVSTLASSRRSDEARSLLEREADEWAERNEPRSARALWALAWVEFWAGSWDRAADVAERAHEISIQYGLEVPQDHLPIALVAVHRGRLDLARDHSERALALADEQFGLQPPQHQAILGLVAWGQGDVAGAAVWLERAEAAARTLGWGEPTIRWWSADLVEVLLDLGRADDAIAVLDAWEADATRLGRAAVLAHVARCRGLVAAAQGELEDAEALLVRAAVEPGAVDDPFGRARALLALGVVRRRSRQKRAAREAIEGAIEGFDALGAAGWAARGRAELARVGGRRAQGAEVTPTERRLAELVAEGRTNKEIAAVLFVTPKTVGTMLSRLYAKLGVHSRTELVRRLELRPPSKV